MRLTLYRTYKFRLLPTRRQHSRLEAALAHTRDLYNAALQERVDVYRKTGKSVTRFQQMRGLAELRADKEWAEYASAMQRWPLVKVDNAFQAFFRRLKAGDKPGYPRFKQADSFKSFGLPRLMRNARNCWTKSRPSSTSSPRSNRSSRSDGQSWHDQLSNARLARGNSSWLSP